MRLEELKQNMSILDQVLSKTSVEVKINVDISETAQDRILKKYRQAVKNCLILTFVFICLWIGNVSSEKLPNMYKAFIVIINGVAAVWYMFLYQRLKNVKITDLSPRDLFSQTTKIKILTLSGEVIFGIALTVFFTLLLSDMFVMNQLVFWLIIGFLAISLLISATYIWPRYVALFRDLNSIK